MVTAILSADTLRGVRSASRLTTRSVQRSRSVCRNSSRPSPLPGHAPCARCALIASKNGRPAERRVDADDVRALDVLHELVVGSPEERRVDLRASVRPFDATRRRAGVLHGEVDADGVDGAPGHR